MAEGLVGTVGWTRLRLSIQTSAFNTNLPSRPEPTMASIIPPRFVPVTHFTTDPDDREGLASDQEWKEEIEVRPLLAPSHPTGLARFSRTDPSDRTTVAGWEQEEIITISLARHLDTALLSQPPPSHAKVPASSAGPPPSAGPSASSTGGAEAGPSTTASSSKKPPTPRHTWSLIVRSHTLLVSSRVSRLGLPWLREVLTTRSILAGTQHADALPQGEQHGLQGQSYGVG